MLRSEWLVPGRPEIPTKFEGKIASSRRGEEGVKEAQGKTTRRPAADAMDETGCLLSPPTKKPYYPLLGALVFEASEFQLILLYLCKRVPSF
jgi:hypothetical protein